VLVGHSYGGLIITEAGMHPDIKALVYVAAVQPDVGESLSDLAGKRPAAAKSIGPVGDGFLAVNPDAFPNDFAADAPEPLARFMAIPQGRRPKTSEGGNREAGTFAGIERQPQIQCRVILNRCRRRLRMQLQWLLVLRPTHAGRSASGPTCCYQEVPARLWRNIRPNYR